MTPACFTLQLTRGDDYYQTWSLTDASTGASLIAAGDVLELVIRAAAGVDPPYLGVEMIGSGVTMGIVNTNTETGSFDVSIPNANIASIPGAPGDQVRCSWKFHVTSSDGVKTTYAYGDCLVNPEP